LRSYEVAAVEDVALWHERDISHSSVERIIGPDATALADFMLRRAAGLVDGLVVKPERMKQNLQLTGGLIFSEGVMLALVRTGLPRQKAYEIVQRSALKARDEGGDFKTLLGADPEVSSRLDGKTLDACFDLQHHLRHADHIYQRAMEE
jgi:adenylosuccinate lyase